MRLVPFALLTALFVPRFHPTPPPPDARTLVDAALAAMGGRERLAGITSLRLEGAQHEYVLGNAERPEGPWRTQYTRFADLRSLDRGWMRRTTVNLAAQPGSPGAAEIVSILRDSLLARRVNGREGPTYAGFYEDQLDQLDAAPVRALLLARAAEGLRSETPVERYGIWHDVVSFPHGSGSIRIEVSAETHLPEAVEIVRVYREDIRRAAFGDVRMRFEYLDWTLEPDGLRWPRQVRQTMNGELVRDATWTAVLADAPAPADSFAIGDSLPALWARQLEGSMARFQLGARGPLPDLADGIVRYRDFWAMTAVRQPDGVVLFEAHLSGDYLDQVIADLERRWPGLPLKAIVLTSDPWAHIGGVREAVARGIPIYASGRSIPFLTWLVEAPHALAPDRLARAPRAPRFVAVDGKTVIGSGPNRIELYPVRGPYAEHMTMAYFPGHRLLYGADLVFQDRAAGHGYLLTPAADLVAAVEREGLAVDSVFCVQATPTVGWRELAASVPGRPR
jgi:hypothetical protein